MSNHAVQAKSYSNKQLRQYTLKMMKKHHLRGSIEIVKNGHAQRVSLGYGYYSKRLKMAIQNCFIQLVLCKRWLLLQ